MSITFASVIPLVPTVLKQRFTSPKSSRRCRAASPGTASRPGSSSAACIALQHVGPELLAHPDDLARLLVAHLRDPVPVHDVGEYQRTIELHPAGSFTIVWYQTRHVIAGEFGNGDARERALGANYAAVQRRVNEMLGTRGPSVDVDALTRAVIRGDYGTTARSAGEGWGRAMRTVQKRVNHMLS
ncbi:hypothetical protein [Atopobium sp. oral taxon 810]|uniref:hypothetical protein n=1 Tax=Atopobium sp. oral taxon 810 TaxID=712158 RepID=UPI0003978D46|nr:Cpl-7 lysozyme protein [Atopobium sp. oral taxon 810 str. F0209]